MSIVANSCGNYNLVYERNSRKFFELKFIRLDVVSVYVLMCCATIGCFPGFNFETIVLFSRASYKAARVLWFVC